MGCRSDGRVGRLVWKCAPGVTSLGCKCHGQGCGDESLCWRRISLRSEISCLFRWMMVRSYHSQFSLFAVVMIYKVTTKNELANIETLFLGRIQGWVAVSLSGHHIFINWFIDDLVLCVNLLKDTLFNIYYWLTNIELTANSTITHTWTKLL